MRSVRDFGDTLRQGPFSENASCTLKNTTDILFSIYNLQLTFAPPLLKRFLPFLYVDGSLPCITQCHLSLTYVNQRRMASSGMLRRVALVRTGV
jgi:hypothetical protein